MKNKIYCFILSILLIVNFTACTYEKEAESSQTPAEFAGKEWVFYNEATGEHQILSFGNDGSYAYHCQCGEPVGNSDLYDKYEYDEEKRIITLMNTYDDEMDVIKILSANEYHLMLEIDGDIKDFSLVEMDTFSNFFSFEGENYFSGYNSRCTVVEMENNKIVYGPVNYDPEGLYENGPFEEYELADDAAFFDLTVNSFNSIQGDQEYEEYYDTSFTEIDMDEAKAITENGAGLAFLWFDEELKVEKLVFFGQTSMTVE